MCGLRAATCPSTLVALLIHGTPFLLSTLNRGAKGARNSRPRLAEGWSKASVWLGKKNARNSPAEAKLFNKRRSKVKIEEKLRTGIWPDSNLFHC